VLANRFLRKACFPGILAIALIGALIYSNTLRVPFYFDDQGSIVENRYLRIHNLTWAGLHDAATKGPGPNRVVANLSFALNYYLNGYDVAGYHVVNIAIHLVNACLVFVLCSLTLGLSRRLSGQSRGVPDAGAIFAVSLLAAMIFVAHPVQVPAVTYIVQRMASLATLFYLAAFICYVLGRQQQVAWRRAVLWTAGLCSWLLALGSKEIASLLPLMIGLYEWYFFRDLKIGFRWRSLVIIGLAIGALFCVALLWLGPDPFRYIQATYIHRDFSIGQRLLTEFRVIAMYLGLIFIPLPSQFSLLHEITVSRALFEPPATFISLVFVLVLIGLAIGIARRQRFLSFFILWFFAHLLIESSVIGLELAYEHRLYLPGVGVSMVIAWALINLPASPALLKTAIATAIVTALCLLTYTRNTVWRDPIVLWSDVISKYPASFRGHVNLGNALARAGRAEDALDQYQQALRIDPRNALIYLNIGVQLLDMGRCRRALTPLSVAARSAPRLFAAQLDYAAGLQCAGKPRTALVYYRKAARLNPHAAAAENGIGESLSSLGRPELAISHYRKALALDPTHTGARRNLSQTLARLRRARRSQ